MYEGQKNRYGSSGPNRGCCKGTNCFKKQFKVENIQNVFFKRNCFFDMTVTDGSMYGQTDSPRGLHPLGTLQGCCP